MSDQLADVPEVDAALETVITALRAHLAAIKAAGQAGEDDTVWRAFVDLHDASAAYDDALNAAYDEATPWELELLPDQDGAVRTTVGMQLHESAPVHDPYPSVVSVRQRRDYRVPSVTALLEIATASRPPVSEGGPERPVTTVAEAVLDLIQSGDGSLAMLDLPELEPLDGVVVIADVRAPYNSDRYEIGDAEGPFRLDDEDRIVAQFTERPVPEQAS